ncbi:hypothetical protein [Henriciella sp.]|uniref:hypothetical protein n=1 Tax=Henriciella sp. TaxID=1968823 RepID=UPI00260E9B0C|nr:hypothetical protein [Henriciella sp.]
MTPEQIIEQEKRRQSKPQRAQFSSPDEIIAHERSRVAREAEGAFHVTRDTKPDEAGKVVDLSERYGTDFLFAQKNRDTMQRSADTQKRMDMLSSFPGMASFLSDPARAAVASDSLEQLSRVETKARRKGNLLGTAATQVGDFGRSAASGVPAMFGRGISGAGDLLDAAVQFNWEYGIGAIPGVKAIGRAEEDFYERNPEIGKIARKANVADAIRNYGGLGEAAAEAWRPENMGIEDRIAEGLGQIAAAVLTGGAGSARLAGGLFAGMGADVQADRMRAQGMDPSQNPGPLAAGAAITGGTEMLRLGSILRILPKEVRSRAARAAVARIAGQGLEEASQESIEALGQNLVTQLGFDEDAELFEGLAEEAGVAGASAAIFQALVETIIPGRARVSQAQESAERLNSIREDVEEAPVTNRRRQDMEAFIEQASDGESVYVDSEAFVELYQSDPSNSEEVARALGLSDNQLAQAFDGTDIELKVSKLTTLENRELYDGLVDISRTSPDAMTPRQAREIEESGAMPDGWRQELDDTVEDVQALEGFERAQNAIQDQLIQAGRSPQEAESLGAVYGAFFRRLAEAGLDEGQIWDQLRLNVQGPQGRRMRKPQEPQTLNAFVRSMGGIREVFGEDGSGYLRGEMQQRVGNLPPGLINNQRGEAVDEIAARAREAGFEIESDESLVEALARDLGGERVYPAGQGEQFRAEMEAFEAQQTPDDSEVLTQAEGGNTKKPRATVQIPGVLTDLPGAQVLQDSDVIVRLSKAADKTTFLHESAHIFLEIYAALEDGNTEIAERMEPVREWLGWKKGEKLTRDQHEKFAGLEGFEGFAATGQVSDSRLKQTFRQFRQWFLDVYRFLRGKQISLDPRAREFFDRMLSSDEDISQAEREYDARYSAQMADIMTPEQIEKYRRYADEAGQVARDRMFRKHLAEINRRDKKQYQEDRARVEQATRERLAEQPVYRVRAGEAIDAETVRELRGDEAVEALGELVSEDGTNAELVAADAGYSSADEMLSDLLAAPEFEQAVGAAVDAEMRQMYGSLRNNEEAYAEAVEAVFNDPAIRRMEAERDALAAKAARDPIPLQAIRQRADQIIETSPLSKVIQPGRYAIKARSLHRKSVQAAAREQWDDALRMTHQAMLQHELARRAYKSREEVTKINRYLARFAPHRKLDGNKIRPDFIEPIRQLISLPGDENQFERLDALRRFSDAKLNENLAVYLPARVVADQPLPLRKDMSLEELREFRDSVKSIYRTGREMSAERDAERAKYHGELAETINTAWGDKPRNTYTRNPTMGDRFRDFTREIDSFILALPFVAESFQGAKRGKVADVLYNDIAEAQGKREDRQYGLEEELVAILDRHGITQKELRKKLHVPQIDRNGIETQGLMALLLNMGSQSNRDRITSDPSIPLDADQVMQIVEQRLEQRHFDAAQEIWDLIDTQRGDLGEVHKRKHGVAPRWVEAQPVVSRYGTYRGGYYPLAYDPKSPVNRDLKEQNTEDLFKAFSAGTAAKAQTNSGMTEERLTNVSRPLDLRLDVLLKHFSDTSALIELSEPIDRAWRAISSEQVGQVLEETHGRAYIDAVKSILRRTATGGMGRDDALNNAINTILRTFRVNAAVAILGHNVTTAALAPVSYAQTVLPRYGGKVAARGLMDFYGNLPKSIDMMHEKSAFMRERSRTLNREASDRVQQKVREGAWSKVQGSGYWLMQTVEKYSVSGPLWHGVYSQSLEDGLTESQAVAEADKAVNTTQGSGRVMDQAVIQGSSNELVRVFSFMWGYVSRYYGVVRNDVAQEAGMKKAFPVIKHMILLNIAASMVESLIRDGIGDEEDPYYENVMKLFRRNILGMVPGMSAFFNKYDSGPAIQQFGTKVTRAGDAGMAIVDDGAVDGENGRRLAEATFEALGFGFGVPGTVQAQKALKTYEEDDDPTIYEALVAGPDNDN